MNLTPEESFELCLLKARDLMGPEQFNSWLSNASFNSYSNGVFTISLDSHIRVNFVTHNYKHNIEELLREITGDKNISVHFTDEPVTLSLGKVTSSPEQQLFSNYLHPDYVFERFVQGPNNRLAYAASFSVAQELGHSSTNPLFIYGGVGLGKTHLVQAIAHEIKNNHPDKYFYCISSEDFTNGYIKALISPNTKIGGKSFKAVEKFKDSIRNCHCLIVDDIQFLAGKDETQNIFFHIFNDLYLQGKQIVLTSDRPPHEIEPLEERLVSRFQSGMVVDIKPPVLETRIAIFNLLLRGKNIFLDEKVKMYIVETVKANVRQLEGVFNVIAANNKFNNIPLTMENVKEIISDYFGSFSVMRNPASITSAVGEAFNINPELLKGKKRKREILIPRQLSMYLIREMTDLSLEDIGVFFGRDHSTVLNAIKRVTSMLETDSAFKRKYNDIRGSLVN
ncbi:chromosomal replication initiator protein DnaA [Candidatus Fermentibacteria bacterium]|nr:MAG: chromosomal replication initiator protein DnaA [Candidatus Fermentibacteria bacterium]PIE52325.1 MAG: chromosomal replication initiator protein DnaA [Candidatus Fermentibacteria bacterium]